jgi:hypothetical protein
VELVTEEAVLGIIDDWWRRGPSSPAPLKAAQITLRLQAHVHRAADAALLVPQVVGTIRDLARRGRVRALPDGSAVLWYAPALVRPAATVRRREAPAAAATWDALRTPAAQAGRWSPPPPAAVRAPTPVPWTAPAVDAPRQSVAAAGFSRADRIILRLMLVAFLVITTGVVAAVDRFIDIPSRPHDVLNCAEAGRVSSNLPPCVPGVGR